ncbi:ABC transporter ATP-binding protein [Reichenbachiella agarivorans]|uniref:ABC transporter ATP-binding protein n=1 Tax=Reichenbachiella agarivorans TaxID=2979464 RepID=A0ABY6CRC3_9BACT|nr:ABC transporter ATP-binding protein [Reichenbachiella agarivorans]UXP33046.1 ABC transporter ATP-binding protein [Reichenbachiella agarivorans]
MISQDCITITGLTKHYQKSSRPALNGIDLRIREGEVFGLLGPNGAGKTTFFSTLCGLIELGEGEVILQDLSIRQDLGRIKQIIGVVPQDIALYPTLSGRDNLLFIGRMYGLKGAELKQRVDSCLDDFGFDANRHLAVKKYSGGMKRKINLIGGILHRPKILLLDEPTVGIDVHSRRGILEKLKAINQTDKATIIYTSHHMEEAEQFCDRVAIIDEGEIIQVGVPRELVTAGNCQNLEELFVQLTGKKIKD